MNIQVERWNLQNDRWPRTGRHILAQYDSTSVVVYQAYRPEIGRFAAVHGFFGGEFSLSRMSWVKPNFLWMMYRNGWGTKPGQEVTLAVRIRREAFDSILAHAIHSSFAPDVYATFDDWKRAVAASEVRLQWDPDHGPTGDPLQRRAIQLGLRGQVLKRFSREWIVAIEDISEFVAEQRNAAMENGCQNLETPREDVYPVSDRSVVNRLGLDVALPQRCETIDER